MAYIGKTPSQATRSRFYYTATGGETSLSGADDNGNTLVFSDGNYVDVMLNGVTLVAGTDYDTDTANTIDNLTALTASDIVEIVVYDTFSVFGGDVKGNFNVQNGTLTAETVTASGLVTAQDGLVVDNDGATVATFDRATSDGTIVEFQKDGSTVGAIGTTNNDLTIFSTASSHGGFRFQSGGTIPVNNSGALADNSFDIGASAYRFKDLYLSGDAKFNSGFGSTATAYGCRAWVNFDGTGTVAIRASGSVSSITDNGTGEYRINFSFSFPDNDYAVAPTQGDNQGRGIIRTDEYNTSNVKVFVRRYDLDVFADDGTVCAIVVR